jgi:hypothetical protein
MGAGREGGLAVTRRTETPSRPPLIDGSTSRFVLLLASIAPSRRSRGTAPSAARPRSVC